jgi:hypothetical protein
MSPLLRGQSLRIHQFERDEQAEVEAPPGIHASWYDASI